MTDRRISNVAEGIEQSDVVVISQLEGIKLSSLYDENDDEILRAEDGKIKFIAEPETSVSIAPTVLVINGDGEIEVAEIVPRVLYSDLNNPILEANSGQLEIVNAPVSNTETIFTRLLRNTITGNIEKIIGYYPYTFYVSYNGVDVNAKMGDPSRPWRTVAAAAAAAAGINFSGYGAVVSVSCGQYYESSNLTFPNYISLRLEQGSILTLHGSCAFSMGNANLHIEKGALLEFINTASATLLATSITGKGTINHTSTSSFSFTNPSGELGGKVFEFEKATFNVCQIFGAYVKGAKLIFTGTNIADNAEPLVFSNSIVEIGLISITNAANIRGINMDVECIFNNTRITTVAGPAFNSNGYFGWGGLTLNNCDIQVNSVLGAIWLSRGAVTTPIVMNNTRITNINATAGAAHIFHIQVVSATPFDMKYFLHCCRFQCLDAGSFLFYNTTLDFSTHTAYNTDCWTNVGNSWTIGTFVDTDIEIVQINANVKNFYR